MDDNERRHYRNSRYKLEQPLDLSLLRVCRQVKGEAEPVFYRGIFFMIDCEILTAICFFKTLSQPVLRDIKAIAITGQELYESPAVDAFGASLTMLLPRLSAVSIYLHSDGSEEIHSNPTLLELFELFKYGQIKTVKFACFGEDLPRDLTDENGREKCMEKMLVAWRKRQAKKAEEGGVEVTGEWINREIDMGSDGRWKAIRALWRAE